MASPSLRHLSLMQFQILSIKPMVGHYFSIDAINAYGRRIGTVVPFWASDEAGIQVALERAYKFQLQADTEREYALTSIRADQTDPPT